LSRSLPDRFAYMPKSLRSARHQRFLAQLISLRNVKGLTQAQVAEKLGRPQSFVAKYEGGERRLDVIEFLDVTAAVDADPCEILLRLRT
ncbi:helix-turn-helix transcriptional regulator, partial [Mesorhizobium sp. M8A.F.Ca.ET.197.01.1.1]|uniref:helix-turn-helix domain-containing protein n=1 Tax=Mesorhizobium sp. M8A.F.Ca.ET.197.01.1.1 TaxID=2563965 RepID=UPI0032B28CCA